MPASTAQKKAVPPVRAAIVKLRVRAEERDAWQAAAKEEGGTLADLIRDRMGESVRVGRSPRAPRANADYPLTLELGRISILLSELAKARSGMDALTGVQLVSVLLSIDRQVALLRPRIASDINDH
jgi:hypothetical protein